MQIIRIATRNSRLALWQAEHTASALRGAFPDLGVELLGMTTEGDRRIDTQLYKLGGKGLFLKELETALRDGRAQVAAHSAKDVPASLPDGLMLCACLQREEARDALVSPGYSNLDELPAGAVVGTSSLRRASILRYLYPHLTIRDIRGNLDTRLNKLDGGDYQALVLAAAGLRRLGLGERIRSLLPTERFVPAIGQGVIALEIDSNNREVKTILGSINHQPSWRRLSAERAFGARLGADCHLPVAAYAETTGDSANLRLTGMVAASDGSKLLMKTLNGSDPRALGESLANELLGCGAAELLARRP